jgi:hypothetical protein
MDNPVYNGSFDCLTSEDFNATVRFGQYLGGRRLVQWGCSGEKLFKAQIFSTFYKLATIGMTKVWQHDIFKLIPLESFYLLPIGFYKLVYKFYANIGYLVYLLS